MRSFRARPVLWGGRSCPAGRLRAMRQTPLVRCGAGEGKNAPSRPERHLRPSRVGTARARRIAPLRLERPSARLRVYNPARAPPPFKRKDITDVEAKPV